MKIPTILLSAFAVVAMTAATHTQAAAPVPSQVTVSASHSVYICGGPKSKRYHRTPHCKGLSRCSCTVTQVSTAAASQKGYTPCHICW